jgi:hypothetical protein
LFVEGMITQRVNSVDNIINSIQLIIDKK